MYRINDSLDLTPHQMNTIIKLDLELRQVIARKHLTDYLEPILVVDDYYSLRFSVYIITPDNHSNTDKISVGVIPVDILPLGNIENNSFLNLILEPLQVIEDLYSSDQLHRQINANTSNLTLEQHEKIAKTVAALSASIIFTTTKDAYGDRKYYTADTAHFHIKTITLLASHLTLEQVMTGLLYELPEEEEDYQEFIGNIITTPAEWLDKLYLIDHQISVNEEKELSLYSILSTPPFV